MLICPPASASFICHRSAFVRKANYKPTCPHLASRFTVAIEPLHSESKPIPHVVQPARASLARGGAPFVLGSLGQFTQNRHTGLGHIPTTVDTVAGSGTRLSGGVQSLFYSPIRFPTLPFCGTLGYCNVCFGRVAYNNSWANSHSARFFCDTTNHENVDFDRRSSQAYKVCRHTRPSNR